MAINLSTSNPLYYAKLFGVDPAVIEKAALSGVQITQSSVGFLSVIAGGHTFGNVTVKGSAITLAKSNTLGPASKAVIKHQLEQLMVKAINSVPTTAPVSEFIGDSVASEGVKFDLPLADEPVPAKVLKTQKMTQAVDPVAEYNIKDGQVDTTNPVKLSEATSLGQAIKGTSNASIYFLAAKLTGINLAIRRTANKMSIRAEGALLQNYSQALASMGMAIKGDYASVHFEVSDPIMVRKTIGSLMGVLGAKPTDQFMDPTALPVKK